MKLTPFERDCVDLYLSIHVSQVSELSNIRQSYWSFGKKIYNERKAPQKLGFEL